MRSTATRPEPPRSVWSDTSDFPTPAARRTFRFSDSTSAPDPFANTMAFGVVCLAFLLALGPGARGDDLNDLADSVRCPWLCACDQTTADCSKKGLDEVPKNLPSDIERLWVPRRRNFIIQTKFMAFYKRDFQKNNRLQKALKKYCLTVFNLYGL